MLQKQHVLHVFIHEEDISSMVLRKQIDWQTDICGLTWRLSYRQIMGECREDTETD